MHNSGKWLPSGQLSWAAIVLEYATTLCADVMAILLPLSLKAVL